jgi:hypothetical protein
MRAWLLLSAFRTSPLSSVTRIPGTGSSLVFWRHSTFLPALAAASTTAASRLRTTLWLAAHTPTFFPRLTRSRIMRAPVKVLPEPGGTLDRERAVVERDCQPLRRTHAAFARLLERASGVAGDARRAPEQEVTRGAVLTGRVHAVLRHPLAEPHERFGLRLGQHHLVREHRGGMQIRAAPGLLDVHGAGAQVDRDHLAERAAVGPVSSSSLSSRIAVSCAGKR